MRESERETIARTTLGFAGSDCEAIVFAADRGLTRFTHNAIHQNLASSDTTVRVRVIDAGRTGVAETNDLREAALRAAVERARTIAKFAPVDGDDVPLAANRPVAASSNAYLAATADTPPEARAAVVSAIVAPSARADLWTAGYVTTASEGVTIANSAGTLVSYDSTSAALNVKANGTDATGYAERFSTDARDLDGAAAGTTAASKATFGAAPIGVDPGAWTVILEPAAFGELLSYLTAHFSAQAVDEGSSFLCDGLDRSYAAPALTLCDEWSHPLHAGMPFDFEGSPRRAVTLVDHGVAKAYVTDARWAKKLARANTGHGLPAPSAEGPLPLYLVVASGSASVDELIAQTKRGLLISRFWYIRPVDQRRTIVTGMTRDGTFLIEDGRIVRGVRNMRFNQSIIEALRNAEFANVQHRTGGYGYSIVTPAAKIENFHFSSVTAF